MPASRHCRQQSRGSAKRNGPRAVLGSQQQPTRPDVHIAPTVPVLSKALRAEDGSRSGGGVKMRLHGIAARQGGALRWDWHVQFLRNTKVVGEAHAFFRRHWQRALRIRERIRISEEAFHLVLAGGVGVIGGLVNIFFYYATESVSLL